MEHKIRFFKNIQFQFNWNQNCLVLPTFFKISHTGLEQEVNDDRIHILGWTISVI